MAYAPSGIQLAGVAQKMVNILAFNCPPTYVCGGPAYAAQAALESILHTMGVGVAVLQRKQSFDMSGYEKEVRSHAVCGPTLIKSFVQHKSQVLAGALHAVLSNNRTKTLRECEEVTEQALMTLLEWYFEKTGASKEAFWKNFLEGAAHDELTRLEKDEE